MVIPCLIENVPAVTDQKCLAFLKRLQPVVFGDYRLIYKFVDRCGSDIDKFHCGRLQHEAAEVKQTVLPSVLTLKKALQHTSVSNPTPLSGIYGIVLTMFCCAAGQSLSGNTKVASKVKGEGHMSPQSNDFVVDRNTCA